MFFRMYSISTKKIYWQKYALHTYFLKNRLARVLSMPEYRLLCLFPLTSKTSLRYMLKRSSHPPGSMMNDLGTIQAVRRGFSCFLDSIPIYLWEGCEKICRESEIFHSVAFHSDLFLGISIVVTASMFKKKRLLLQPT